MGEVDNAFLNKIQLAMATFNFYGVRHFVALVTHLIFSEKGIQSLKE